MAEYARRRSATRALSDQIRKDRTRGITSHGGDIMVKAEGQVVEADEDSGGGFVIRWTSAQQIAGDFSSDLVINPHNLPFDSENFELPPGPWIATCTVLVQSDFGMDLDGDAEAFLNVGTGSDSGQSYVTGQGNQVITSLNASGSGKVYVSCDYNGPNLDRFIARLTAWKGTS